MSWTIGGITLPRNPSKVKCKPAAEIKSVALLKQLPLLLPFGPATRVLTLEGWIQEAGKTAEQLATDYLIPFRDIVEKGMRFPQILGDDGMVASGKWAGVGWGSGSVAAAVLADDTTKKAFGLDSLRLTIFSDIYHWSGAQRTFSPARDLSNLDFISCQVYGDYAGSVAVELYDGSVTEEVSKAFASLNWYRKLFVLSDFTSVDLTNITRFRIGVDTGGGLTWLDRICIGVGVLVVGPGTRYDGIYILKQSPWEERGGVTRAFPYKMDLWCVDDYY